MSLSFFNKKLSAVKNDRRGELACLNSDQNVEIDAKQTTRATVTSNEHNKQFIGSSATSKSMNSNIGFATSDTAKPPAKTTKAGSTSNKKCGYPNNALHDLNPNTVRRAPKRRMIQECLDRCDPNVFYELSPLMQQAIIRNPEAFTQSTIRNQEAFTQSTGLPEQEIAYQDARKDAMSSLQDCHSCKLGEDTTTNDATENVTQTCYCFLQQRS